MVNTRFMRCSSKTTTTSHGVLEKNSASPKTSLLFFSDTLHWIMQCNRLDDDLTISLEIPEIHVSLPKFAHTMWKSAPWCAAVVFVKCFHRLLLSVRNVDSRKCANWCCCTYFDLVLLTSLCIFHPCSSRRGGKIWSKYQFLSISDYLVLYLLKTLWSGAGAGRKEQFKCCTMHNALCTLRKAHLKRLTSKTKIFSLKFFHCSFFSFLSG